MAKGFLTIFFLLGVCSVGKAQSSTVTGRVSDGNGAAALASVKVVGSNKGTLTDERGQFTLDHVSKGRHLLIISSVGYQTRRIPIAVESQDSLVVNVQLEQLTSALNDVVITGTRTQKRRLQSPVAVNILGNKTFDLTQSNTISEGLCFQPGLRMETDCQTCNYSQLRMNGLGGSYSQILINSRPVFTSLMSLYGLDQIPANMIDKIEVVRGGGSVLYGSAAIAGTVNILTKEPAVPSFTISANTAAVKGNSYDSFYNLNGNVVNEQRNAGTSIFASHRDRDAFDANGDGFSEIAKLSANSFGFNSFFKFSPQSRLEINGWSLHEERRGGNKIDEQADKADQSEYRLHNILLGGVSYEHSSADKRSSYSLYAAGQKTARTHYTGMDHSDAWGRTRNHSFQGGLQYNWQLRDLPGREHMLTIGTEVQHEYTFDQIPLYAYLIDQEVNLFGAFLQSDWNITRQFSVLSGLRINKSNRVKKMILTPRISTLYKIGQNMQVRASYARGFKAPQAFETDMHIAFAGGGVSLIKIDPELKEEISNSFNASVDYNKANEKIIYGFTADAFYTRLRNAFILEEIGTDGLGNQQLLRKNGSSSTVRGVTLEGRFNYNQKIQIENGVTLQKAEYQKAVSWSSELPGSNAYLRTPEVYGYYIVSLFPQGRWNASVSGIITGPMKVPHFKGAQGVEQDELVTSPFFHELHLKLAYKIPLKGIQQDLQIYAGIQNLFNQYQKDFDTGKNRDSNYIYGPLKPITYFAGFKFGLL